MGGSHWIVLEGIPGIQDMIAWASIGTPGQGMVSYLDILDKESRR